MLGTGVQLDSLAKEAQFSRLIHARIYVLQGKALESIYDSIYMREGTSDQA